MIKSEELRGKWFSFWVKKGHDIVPSAPLVPINDDTLLWINSGVATLKKYFDGRVIPNNKRMANIQKCIRTNDIDNVGFTRRHATFFEMMGNFSIGDYFKKEAIEWSYEFLTEVIGLDKEKIYVTIYPTDEEAYNAWKNLGLPDDKIIRLESNFWEIGVGPSGPDSEIFYDRGEEYDQEGLGIRLLKEEIENDRYMEVWNNVFSMYNANPSVSRDKYEELPSKNIDTGMGFERLLMVMQEVDSIYDTDLFSPIISKLEELSGVKYDKQASFRAISDHIRTVTMAISDSANFGNNGRDYVLRRLLRRAVMFGKKLGIDKPFMYEMVPLVIDKMSSAYPHLIEKKEIIISKVKKEEELFHSTLVMGEKKFSEIVENSKEKISGADAFKLYDTYGFPFEITLEMALEKGLSVSIEEFDECMQTQKELARNSRNVTSSMNMQNEALIKFDLKSEFIGYDYLESDSQVIAIFDGEKFVESATEGYFILDKTPFYAESGGQVSDSGYITLDSLKIEVLDLFKGPNKHHFHYFKSSVNLQVNDFVKCHVDSEKRNKIMRNHSSVHLAQKALKEMFGNSVAQAGSYVDEHYMRFDFTVDAKVTVDDIIKLEEIVNSKIGDFSTRTEILALDEAVESGAIALFEDKYESNVRVVTIGDSKELCGGTHVKNVSEIEKFVITNFESKGNNTYRLDGSTSVNCSEQLFRAIKPYNDNMIKLLIKARKLINQAKEEGISLDFHFDIDNDSPKGYNDVIFNQKEMERLKLEVARLDKLYNEEKIKLALSNISFFEEMFEEINAKKVIIKQIENYQVDIIKEITANLANRFESVFIFFAIVSDNAVNFVARTNIKEINVGQLVKDASLKSLGNGGGSPQFAQGGGSDTSHIESILDLVKEVVKK